MKPALLHLATLSLLTGTTLAAPYASGLSVSGNTISFILNEAADKVSVSLNNGASTLNLGPRPAGTHSFDSAGATSWQIIVEKAAPPGWRSGALQQISSDANPLTQYVNGRGVCIARSPKSRSFGRVYVSVGSSGTTTTGRLVPEGIYPLNADLSATPLGTNPLTGGLSFTASTESPYRLTAGDDGTLYIADWSDQTGTLYSTDADVANGTNLLAGPVGSPFPVTDTRIHGSIAAVAVEGSLATSDLKLWLVDEDLQDDKLATTQSQTNSLWDWRLNAEAPFVPLNGPPLRLSSAGIAFASQTADIVRSKTGTFYKTQRRSVGNESGVFILDSTGITLDSSLTSWRTFKGDLTLKDVFIDTVAADLTDDGQFLAVLRRDNAFHIVHVGTGLFDFNRYSLFTTTPVTAAARDIAFDPAGNVYMLSSGNQLLRVFAPGGTSKATTGSDATFSIAFEPLPPPTPIITAVTGTPNAVVIDFSAPGASLADFALERSPDLATWLPDASAQFAGESPSFSVNAVGITPGSKEFFRVRRLR